MALIDKASLLMVPSTYEAGTLYNVLPSGNRAPDSTDQNSGYDQTRADFTFDRGSNAAATRVNADGLIEKYRENLLLQSNQFDTTWSTNNASVTSGKSGYDGTNNAWELKENTSTGVHEIIQTLSVSTGVQTYSLKVSANTRSKMALVLAGSAFNSGGNGVGIFDLTNGTLISSSGSLIDAKITSLDGNWYNVSITKLASSSSAVAVIQLVDDSNNTNYTGNGTGSIYIQNAQLETGLVATDYLDSGATTAKAGVLIDLPRINYDANGENGALLLEPQRANLIQYSEYFGAWTGFGGVQTITDNYAISPEGVQNAARVQLERSPSLSRIQLSTTGTIDGVSFVFSVYLKANSGSPYVYLQAGPNFSTAIEVTNEWKRYDLLGTASGGTTTCIIGISDSVSGTTETADILVYGAQLESSASYATSYIPNHGESGGVTRAADSCSVTGVSDVIGQTEGTIFVDFTFDGITSENRQIFQISDGSTNNLHFRIRNSNDLQAYGTGNFSPFDERLSLTADGRYKMALGYSNGDFAYYVNGVQIATDTQSTSASNLSEIYLGINNLSSTPLGGQVTEAVLFNERLTNEELATLTTL